MSIERDEFTEALNRLYHGIDGVNARLDILNVRTRSNELDIATIKAKFVAYTGAASIGLTVLVWALEHVWK